MRKIKKVTPSPIAEHARRFAEATLARKEAEDEVKEVKTELLPMMQSEHINKERVQIRPDLIASVAVKTRSTSSIDPEKLKKALGAKVFNKLTRPVLDEAKLEAAISAGDVDPNLVASCMEYNENPYLEARFTKKKVDDEDGGDS